MFEKSLQSKKVAIVIAFRNFRDPEYFIPKGILKSAGAEVVTLSTKKGVAVGADGGEAEVDFLVSEINPSDFDAIVFVGGPGMSKELDNEELHNLARKSLAANKVLGSICIAGALLAKAGLLNGVKATVWSSSMDKSPIKILEENGAIYQEGPVVVDGKIVTANGPSAAEEFGEKLVEVLTKS